MNVLAEELFADRIDVVLLPEMAWANDSMVFRVGHSARIVYSPDC